jgi:hypothetical protein
LFDCNFMCIPKEQIDFTFSYESEQIFTVFQFQTKYPLQNITCGSFPVPQDSQHLSICQIGNFFRLIHFTFLAFLYFDICF